MNVSQTQNSSWICLASEMSTLDFCVKPLELRHSCLSLDCHRHDLEMCPSAHWLMSTYPEKSSSCVNIFSFFRASTATAWRVKMHLPPPDYKCHWTATCRISYAGDDVSEGFKTCPNFDQCRQAWSKVVRSSSEFPHFCTEVKKLWLVHEA